jgi:hypothetical protein
VRQALYLVELSARGVFRLRDKDSNPGFRVQSAASCRLDDPGSRSAHRPPSTFRVGRSTQRRACLSMLLSHAREVREAILSMPLACSSTLDRRSQLRVCEFGRPTWRRFGAGRSCSRSKTAGKSRTANAVTSFSASGTEEPFSLRRGLESYVSFSSWASPLWSRVTSLETTKATFRSPSLRVACRSCRARCGPLRGRACRSGRRWRAPSSSAAHRTLSGRRLRRGSDG